MLVNLLIAATGPGSPEVAIVFSKETEKIYITIEKVRARGFLPLPAQY